MTQRKLTIVRGYDSTQKLELATYVSLSIICGLAFCVMCFLIFGESKTYLSTRREYNLALAQRQPIMIKLLDNYRRSQRLDNDTEFVKSIMKIRQGYVEQGETSLAIEFEQTSPKSK